MSSQPPSMPNLPNPEAIFESWWPIIIGIVGGVAYALRQYMRGARCISELKLDDKVAIVTGGGSGMGRYLAIDLAKRGCKVYTTARTQEQAQATEKEIREMSKSELVHCLVCELDKFSSVKSFVSAFKKKEDHLNYLIHNAGVMMCEYNKTEEGFEEQFQVNYLSPFLMTSMLLDYLKSSTPSRVLLTVAPAYKLGSPPFTDCPPQDKYNPGDAYAQSKLALVLFGVTLAEKLKDDNIHVHCVLPGVVNTKIYRHLPFRKSAFVGLSFAPFIWFLMKTPEDGAQTTLYALLSESAGKTSGKIYKECAEVEFTDIVKNEELQHALWKHTLEWTKVKEFGQ
ncbi:retinol dehydrogenase 13-like isoform X1 [Saccostrea echinata]|uniref:retinol dehydrogenase 13-like isoform X1 n=2 Tax=Saccostrea echinata TaxID=191078 RepID=UPI002A806DC3|nr:retinol dehydrogenase 13-like isoform X1 [Saccostrea echinata]